MDGSYIKMYSRLAEQKPLTPEQGYALYHSIGHRPKGKIEMAKSLASFVHLWNAPSTDVWPKTLALISDFRHNMARLLGKNVTADEIALVGSVTAGLLHLIDGLGAKKLQGRSVLIADDAFPSLHFLLQGMAEKYHFTIERVAIRQGQYYVTDEDYIAALNKNTILALVTWVSSTSSAMANLQAIADTASDDCLLVCDVTQGIGIRDLELPTRYDALITSSLKWLSGSAGAGVLWVKASKIDMFNPGFRGWFSQENPMNWDLDNFCLSPTSSRFENGTPNPLPYVASLPGLKWIIAGGLDKQKKHNLAMTEALLNDLQAANMNIVTPMDNNKRGGSVMVHVGSDKNAKNLTHTLQEKSIAIDNRGAIIRFSPGILTAKRASQLFVNHLITHCR